MKVAVYDVTSGVIGRRCRVPADHVAIQCQEGEEFYLNCPDWATHIINNEPVQIAPPPPTDAELIQTIRAERNRRLAASDWTMAPDAPTDKQAWATYRQALRDFPATVVDLNNPAWPTPPA